MISQVRPRLCLLALKCCAGLLFVVSIGALAQEPKKPPPQPGPMLADGIENFDTPDFQLSLVRSSQTAAALHPKSDAQFDFTPGDRLTERSHEATTIRGTSIFASESRKASGKITQQLFAALR